MNQQPKYLWFLFLSYTMVILLSNWFDPRIIRFWIIDTDAGTLIFPLTYLLSAMITEVYGYKQARLAIWCGLLFNIIFILYGQLIIRLPSPEYAINNHHFDAILSMNSRIIVASIISYFCAEPLNALFIAKSKIKMKGQYIRYRFMLSTILASALDSCLFGMIAFYGMFSKPDLIELIVGMWFIKTIIEIIGSSMASYIVPRLKLLENIDPYDTDKNFTLFSLDVKSS